VKNACFVRENGKEIFELKFFYDDMSEALPLIEECARQVRQRPLDSVLTMTIIGKGRFTPELVEKLKQLTKGNGPHVHRASIVGVTGLYKVVISAITIFSKRDFKLFDTREAAIRYLTSG